MAVIRLRMGPPHVGSGIVGRIEIDPTGVPIGQEALEHLAIAIQREVGDEHDVMLPKELPPERRDGGAVSPFIEVLVSAGGGVLAATILAGVKAGVKKWRGAERDDAPPRSVTKIQVSEFDETGQLRRLWTEETEETAE